MKRISTHHTWEAHSCFIDVPGVDAGSKPALPTMKNYYIDKVELKKDLAKKAHNLAIELNFAAVNEDVTKKLLFETRDLLREIRNLLNG